MSEQKLKEETDDSFLSSRKIKWGKRDKDVGVVNYMHSEENRNSSVKLKEGWMILLCFLSGSRQFTLSTEKRQLFSFGWTMGELTLGY